MSTSSPAFFRLIQLSDLHLGARADFRLAGIPTHRSFSETLNFAVRELNPDHLILTGDLAADCEEQAYAELSRQLAGVDVPFSCLPGNHDDPDVLGRFFPCQHREVTLAGWRLLLLDTRVAGEVGGNLGQVALDRVADVLAREDRRPVLVFMHHPPLSVGCAWLDRQQVASGPELLALLAAHSSVKAAFTGHVHQARSIAFAHFQVHTTPSTCFQFTPGSDDFSIDDLPPGLRIIDLYPEGHLDTRVLHLRDFAFRPERGSSGY